MKVEETTLATGAVRMTGLSEFPHGPNAQMSRGPTRPAMRNNLPEDKADSVADEGGRPSSVRGEIALSFALVHSARCGRDGLDCAKCDAVGGLRAASR